MGWDRAIHLEMGNLRRRMNTGIGSTCTMDGNRVAQHSGDRVFNIRLNRALVGLTLPAMEVSSEILNDEGNSFGGGLHGSFRGHRFLGFAHQLNNGHFRVVTATTHGANNPGIAPVAIAIAIVRTGKQIMHQFFIIDIPQSLTTSR